MENASLISSRLTRKNLVKELEKQKIQFDNYKSKEQLINQLENQLVKDVKKSKIGECQKSDDFLGEEGSKKI
ncbi:hypothetical protein C2G38_2220499 [Gigaspora rosea]|uniref:HeH/LEM domain-containing protein n=1 Tax=Gigaspora rosea TaxID=44941 RepID=A0A397U631_9GLOM|nr:hypothetical protein C2G38_2220499 [Gigaspora rosea]